MTTPAGAAGDPDAIWREWLGEILSAAADRFGLVITGPPAYGWRDRSIGTPALGRAGPRWLRVVTEDARWAHGDFWTGNVDANRIQGIAKPAVLDTAEWQEGPRRVRAEMMTVVPGHPCSSSDVLRQELDLPSGWWAELRRSLDVLAATPTRRISVDAGQMTDRLRGQLGIELDPGAVTWGTAHGDLHWANLFGPQLAIIDWEGWGCGPVGLDAATLYYYSLPTPDTAAHVYRTFHDILSTPAGTVAQLYAIARLLARAGTGDHPDLAVPLRQHAEQLTGATR